MTHPIAAYTDIDLELSRQKDGDVKILTDLDAIKTNLFNIVKTLQGSRRMQPEFAFGPTNYLYEPISETNAKNIGHRLISLVEQYEDRILLNTVNVYTSELSYQIQFIYTLKELGSQSTEYTLTFILKQL